MIDQDWKKELIETGNIVQDHDTTVSQEEAERRFNRYIEMLDSIQGNEGLECACTVIRSLRAKQDYGAYQTSHRVLGKFPREIYTQAMVLELPALIEENEEWAGELLCGLANSQGTQYEPDIYLFMDQLYQVEEKERNVILGYIDSQESKGWLSHRVGALRRKVEPNA